MRFILFVEEHTENKALPKSRLLTSEGMMNLKNIAGR